jgi:hypothetical protein
MTVLERAQKYLSCCEGAISGSGGHDLTFRVANALVHGFCLEPETAYQLLRDIYNPKCSPPWRDYELRHKIKSACRTISIKGRGYLLGPSQVRPPREEAKIPPPDAKPVFDPNYLRTFTARLPDSATVDPDYLEIRSQFSCHNRSPAGFLHKIFRPGESVWITTNSQSRDGFIWTHEGRTQNLAELDYLKAGHSGVWFLSNPIDGLEHQTERLVSEFNPLGASFRCSDCTTSWRHVVIETDDAPAPAWLKALVLLELPIVAIYHSGKRGAHALVNLGSSTSEQWHAQLGPHLDHLIRLGACPKTLTQLRLSRLPNCRREQTGQLQQLLYLTPDADGTPIVQHPLREDPLPVWMRYIEAARFGPSDNL